jgi:hypothetical protein
LQTEIVDARFRQHRGKGRSEVAHVDAEVGGPVSIDLHLDLLAVEMEVGLDKGEAAALSGSLGRSWWSKD